MTGPFFKSKGEMVRRRGRVFEKRKKEERLQDFVPFFIFNLAISPKSLCM